MECDLTQTGASLSKTTFTCADLGQNAVVLTVDFDGGDQATCQATVIVKDDNNPCPDGCGDVANISVDETKATEATVSWDAVAGASSYTLRHRPIGMSTWTNVNTATATIIVTGLAANTQYECQVRAECTEPGAYSNSFFIITPKCDVAENLNITNLLDVTATVNWNAVTNATLYKVRYAPTGTGSWSQGNTVDLFKNATNLTAGTTYDYQIRSECPAGWGAWSGVENFTTESCTSPSNITITTIGTTSASFTWGAVPGAIRYKFFYRPTAGGAWTTVNANTNSYTLLGLTDDTEYEFGLRTICGYGPSGNTTITTFTTLTGAVCDIPTNPAVSGITSNSATVNWDAMPDAIKYKISYRDLAGGPWTTRNAFTTGILLTGLNANANYVYRLRTHCPSGLTALGPANYFTTVGARLTETSNSGKELTIFPNPSAGRITIVLEGISNWDELVDMRVDIFDMVGRNVYQWTGKTSGSFIHFADITSQPKGQYLVKVVTGNETFNTLLVITK